jgi:hypothetical protein
MTSQTDGTLEEHWRAIFDHAAGEHDREKLAEFVVKVSHFLDTIESRMMELDGFSRKLFRDRLN